MNVFYFYIFILAHPYLAMWWKSFELADRKPWEALIPGYNYYIAFKISCAKPWWSLLMVFPGVHLAIRSGVIFSWNDLFFEIDAIDLSHWKLLRIFVSRHGFVFHATSLDLSIRFLVCVFSFPTARFQFSVLSC